MLDNTKKLLRTVIHRCAFKQTKKKNLYLSLQNENNNHHLLSILTVGRRRLDDVSELYCFLKKEDQNKSSANLFSGLKSGGWCKKRNFSFFFFFKSPRWLGSVDCCQVVSLISVQIIKYATIWKDLINIPYDASAPKCNYPAQKIKKNIPHCLPSTDWCYRAIIFFCAVMSIEKTSLRVEKSCQISLLSSVWQITLQNVPCTFFFLKQQSIHFKQACLITII